MERIATRPLGSQIAAHIAYEDTEERARLKAEGYAYYSPTQQWQKRAGRAEAGRLLRQLQQERGYTLMGRLDDCLLMIEALHAAGVAPEDMQILRDTGRSDQAPQPVKPAFIARTIAEDDARMAAKTGR